MIETPQNIIIAGIAGQGVVFCSDILCSLLFGKKIFLKKCDSYGFAQRGGSVVSQIRIHHEEIFSPTISPKECTQFILLHEGQRTFLENILAPKGKFYEITPEEKTFVKKESIDLQKVKNIYLLSKLLLQLDKTLLQELKDYLTKNLIGSSLIQNENAIRLLQSWENYKSSLQIKPSPIGFC